jgi:ketosteroid isomerase-like protein
MSQENVEIVRRCCDAFDRRDYDGALAFLDPEVEYELLQFPDGEVYRGLDGVREAFRIWLGTWENYRQERGELIEVGGEVIVPTCEYGRGKGSGLELDRLTYGVWTLRVGKVTRIRFYATEEEALEGAGLRE